MSTKQLKRAVRSAIALSLLAIPACASGKLSYTEGPDGKTITVEGKTTPITSCKASSKESDECHHLKTERFELN